MIYKINNEEYEVIVSKKKNKNTYIRVKDDMKIYVATNYLVSNHFIKTLLDKNEEEIKKMIDSNKKKNQRKELFYYLGSVYDIIVVPTLNDVEMDEKNIYVKSMDYLNKWLSKECLRIYQERLNIIYNKFEESIPNPNLKIRKMTSRWGVCNRKNNNITINSELIKYNMECIDYVITHELSHFVYFDHSVKFWNIVFKYFPNYKKIRKLLKEG